MRKKVYCKNCEYFNPRFHKNFNCEIPGNIIDTWKRENVKQLRMFVAAERNKSND